MNWLLKKETKGQIKMKKAFTLIELMIVMAVMAILVGIALPSFKGMKEEGNIAKAEGELRTLQTAVESYAIHHGNAYPANSNTPYDTYFDTAGCAPGPQLISSVIYDPFAGANTEYYYRRGSGSGGLSYYAVCSRGKNGAIDVTSAEIGDGILTTAEIDDDIVATNCARQ